MRIVECHCHCLLCVYNSLTLSVFVAVYVVLYVLTANIMGGSDKKWQEVPFRYNVHGAFIVPPPLPQRGPSRSRSRSASAERIRGEYISYDLCVCK